MAFEFPPPQRGERIQRRASALDTTMEIVQPCQGDRISTISKFANLRIIKTPIQSSAPSRALLSPISYLLRSLFRFSPSAFRFFLILILILISPRPPPTVSSPIFRQWLVIFPAQTATPICERKDVIFHPCRGETRKSCPPSLPLHPHW